LKETTLAFISSIGKRNDEDTHVTTNSGTNGNVKQLRQREMESSQVMMNSSFRKVVVATNPAATVFRYVPKSGSKDGEAPFSKCTTIESATKPVSKFNVTDCLIIGDKGVLPTHIASQRKVARAPLFGSVISSKGSLQEESDLQKVHTDDGFDPNEYKLMKKSGYDFNKPVSLGHVIEAKPYGFNKRQKKIRE